MCFRSYYTNQCIKHHFILLIFFYFVVYNKKINFLNLFTGGKSKDDIDGERKGGEITYSQASGIKMEDLINEYLTTDENVILFFFSVIFQFLVLYYETLHEITHIFQLV